MLYLLYGKDTFRSARKLNELLVFFRKKINNLTVFEVSTENFNKETLNELTSAQMLFEKKYVVVCANLMADKVSAQFVLDNLEKFSKSQNTFLFLEEEINTNDLKSIQVMAGKIQHFGLLSGARLEKWITDEASNLDLSINGQVQEKITNLCGSDLWCASNELEKHALGGGIDWVSTLEPYNPFHICDAFTAKNKSKMWVLFQKALMVGVPAEEVFWKIWWQTKNLLMVKNLLDAQVKNIQRETGLHPFVVKKTLSALRNFTGEELRNYSSKLVDIYHDTRKGKTDFAIGLERFLISI